LEGNMLFKRQRLSDYTSGIDESFKTVVGPDEYSFRCGKWF